MAPWRGSDSHLDDAAADAVDHGEIAQQALLFFDEGISDVRANVGSLEPIQHVLEYVNWVLIADHEPMMSPGVDEFNRIADLVVSCKRVYQEEDRAAILKFDYALSDGHDYKTLVQDAGMHVQGSDGTVVLGFQGPELADWIDAFPRRHGEWLISRSQCYRKMRRSGFFEELPQIALPSE